MEQTADPVKEQVREIVEAVVDALRVSKPVEESPLVAANSFEAENLRAEIIRVGRKLWERHYVDGALTASERWSAILTVVIQPPHDKTNLDLNPLGIYIDALNWSKELVARVDQFE